MYDYDIPERTVTLTLDEYRDLVADAGRYRTLINYGLSSWDKYSEIMCNNYYSDDSTNWSFEELDVFAFNLLEDEDSSDYEISVALDWLLHRCKPVNKVGEWCAIMRDLEYQLKQIYKSFEERD